MSRLYKLAALLTSSLYLASAANAFELASENTMGSVAIVAADSADALISAASTPDGYRDIRYELMPFKSSVSVDLDDTNEVSQAYDYAQIQAVDQQTGVERQKVVSNQLVETLREFLPESVTSAIGLDSAETTEGTVLGNPTVQAAASVVFGQLEQSFELISAGVNTISYNVTRYLEQFSAINVGFNPDDGTLGSFHVSDMQSTSNITITQHD